MKWLWRLLGGPARPVKTGERKTALAKTDALKNEAVKAGVRSMDASSNTAQERIKPTVHLPSAAPTPDLTQLAAKYAKDPKKRHHKHKRGRQLPNGAHR